jgi:CheY-like chemotaxis protein
MRNPGIHDLYATRKIRQLPDKTSVPIIALTGNAFSEDRTRCLDAGMNDFITKPFNIKTLFETLLKWLSQNNPS